MSASLDFPTPYTVGHHVHSDGALDANNQAIPVYTPPLDQPGVEVAVMGWETPKSSEPSTTGHINRVEVTTKLFVPPAFRPGTRDVVDLPGVGRFEVTGIAENADANPFAWNPGSTINLRQVSG